MNQSKDLMQAASVGDIKTPRLFAQLAVIAPDGSGSMVEPAPGGLTKAEAAEKAIRDTMTRVKVSRKASNFDFAVIPFGTAAEVRLPPTPVAEANDYGDYNPLKNHGDGTDISRALESFELMADAYFGAEADGGVPRSAVLIVASDGLCQNREKTKEAANRIKKGPHGGKITICATLIAKVGAADSEAEALLREICSNPATDYKTTYDAETLRNFLVYSLSKASGVQLG